MVGEARKCPECGADLPEGNVNCPLCTPDVQAGRAVFDRNRRRRRKAALVALAAIISALILWPIVADLTTPVTQKVIISADDLGPEWRSSTPYKQTYQVPEGGEGAVVQISRDEGPSHLEGNCFLVLYPSQQEAEASYQSAYERAFSGTSSTGLENVTAGDMAFIHSTIIEDRPDWNRHIVMRQGSWIAFITLLTHTGPGIETSLMVELAEIQATKLP